MEKIKIKLIKRRKMTFFILLFVAIISLIINHFFTLTPPSYIKPTWRMNIVYILIIYKVIELGVFYLIFYRKHYLKTIVEEYHIDYLNSFEKNAKRFFFLVPQGSIVFGILSYKLSSDIRYLLLFLLIAAFVLLMVNPEKLK